MEVPVQTIQNVFFFLYDAKLRSLLSDHFSVYHLLWFINTPPPYIVKHWQQEKRLQFYSKRKSKWYISYIVFAELSLNVAIKMDGSQTSLLNVRIKYVW